MTQRPSYAFGSWAQTIMPEEIVPAGEVPDHRCGDCSADRKPFGVCGYEHGAGWAADYCARTGTLWPWRHEYQLTLDETIHGGADG